MGVKVSKADFNITDNHHTEWVFEKNAVLVVRSYF